MILKVRGHFDAAHRLVGYDGDCSKLHGHRWEVLASLRSTERDEVGISVDFKRLKLILKSVLPDHAYLNDLVPLFGANPTAENLLLVIVSSIREALKRDNMPAELVELELWESPGCSVVWRETE